MTQEELEQMITDEERHLGVGSREFMKRHYEIMDLIEHAGKEKETCQRGSI